MKKEISIIIPVAPGENLHDGLIEQLTSIPGDWEVLICSDRIPDQYINYEGSFRWIYAETGRANSLNEGAKNAKGQFLWFLHADSILAEGCFAKLKETAQSKEAALFYFDLKFIRATRRCFRFNELGVLFRTRFLKTPFGDQGFFMEKEVFEKYGPYSTEAKYGEDHLFVRKLRRSNIKTVPFKVPLYTSPRKYERNGWLKTTALYQYLWLKQALLDWLQFRGEKSYENSNRGIL